METKKPTNPDYMGAYFFICGWMEIAAEKHEQIDPRKMMQAVHEQYGIKPNRWHKFGIVSDEDQWQPGTYEMSGL